MSIFTGDGHLEGWRPAHLTHSEICGSAIRRYSLAHVTWMGKLSWFQANPYDPAKHNAQDRELLSRAHSTSKYAGVTDILVGVRERKLSVKTQFRGRRLVTALLIGDWIRTGEWRSFAAGIVEPSKFFLDIAAITTGLNYRLLRHRAAPCADQECEKWKALWSDVNTHASLSV